MTIDDYLEIVKRAQANGVKPGESMEKEFVEYAKEKKLKCLGATELTKEELACEHASHGRKVLKVDTDENGQQSYQVVKPKEE